MTYFARHLVDALTTPLVVALLLSIGAGVLWIRGRRRMAGALLACASVGVYLFSLVPLGDAMLGPLEHQYHSIGVRTALPSVRYVVVLGSSYAPRADVSAVAAQDCEGLVRIVEALRVIRRLPGARLVLSGGAAPGRVSPARGYAEVARDLGIDERSLIVLDTPLNTEAEARAIVAAIGMQPFLLVTSAWHM